MHVHVLYGNCYNYVMFILFIPGYYLTGIYIFLSKTSAVHENILLCQKCLQKCMHGA